MALQIRRGTQAEWEANKSNIVAGEPAIATDSGRFFVGTGSGTYAEFANADDVLSNANGAVDTTNLADGAVTTAKLNADVIALIDSKASSEIDECIVNMRDFFWVNGAENISTRVSSDELIETLYLLISGSKDSTTLTVESGSPLAISDLKTTCFRGIIEYNDGSVDLVSLYVDSGALTIYPPLKADISSGKIYSEAYGIHLSKAGYKYYATALFNANKKYTQKKKAIAQYNPFKNVTPNPLTKIGSFWWGKGVENVINANYRVVEHGTTDFLNCSFVTGATESNPKGFEWEQTLDGKSGYFEMYIGGRDTSPKNAVFANGLEWNIEFYLDGVLKESIVKTEKKIEPIRFNFANAQTGKVKLYTTSGASTYALHLTQATWWETDKETEQMFESYKVPCLLMDSWGVYHDNAFANTLAALLTTNGMAGYVVNNSLGSQTSNWGVSNFYEKAWAEHPAYMITDFQINDINTGVTQATFNQNIENLIAASITNGIIPVVLLQCHATPNGDYGAYTFPFIAQHTVLPS